jgi:hypothetical protein
MDGTGSRSCPVADCGFCGVGPSSSATTVCLVIYFTCSAE